ncbi:right-handed parallel beta-helix repeat-containing protein [Lusitaniella coriacea]|uniref:right-handed parallel beta-helix repeat-containing protein n=1 Tax=Lusitaniella coriacea TaxID=1983105 RepID=UPI003CF9C483
MKWLIDTETGERSRLQKLSITALVLSAVTLAPPAVRAQPAGMQITVNGNGDEIQPDGVLTLREAIALVNGTLEDLSESERAQVVGSAGDSTRIGFNLPPGQTTILLNGELPAIASPGVTIDGTTQSGYDIESLEAEQGSIPTPVVVITTTPGQEIARGLTIVADNVTIRGLSVYGFNSPSRLTEITGLSDLVNPGRITAKAPPADIFISNPDVPDNAIRFGVPNTDEEIPPQGILIEYNWLGTPPNSDAPVADLSSAFGVYVFDGNNTTIRRNAIANQQGSAIITSIRANNLDIRNNLIADNGFAGMPDAIRLEGEIDNSAIASNLIRGNAGSGIYLFKPEGSATIEDNIIIDNGRRYKRAAIYITGSGHQIQNNRIANQPGPGVVVARFPDGHRVNITNNQFSNLQGLAIDLVAQSNAGVQAYQSGDGANPPVKIHHRRRQVANYGINAPRFASREFLATANRVTLVGTAEPGAEIEIYRVESGDGNSGTTSFPIARISTDDEGRFSAVLTDFQEGDTISAIATHPDYGTSEPAISSTIRQLPGLQGEVR